MNLPILTKGDEPDVLVHVKPYFVSLVDFGANHGNRKHFFVLKREEMADDVEPAVEPEPDVEKAVPDADASDEDKRASQETRSTKYGIEALEAAANLSYPSGDPTTESLYGDPVNLKYPLGREANKRDAARIRNAVSRFKQAHGTYSKDSSKGRIYERIVRAALAEDIDVSYDAEDPIDKLLPGDLKDRLSKELEVEQVEIEADDGISKRIADVALQSQLLDTRTQVQALHKKTPVEPAPRVQTPPEPAQPQGDDVQDLEKRATDAEAKAADTEAANATLKAELEKAEIDLRTERATRARLQKDTGSMTGLGMTGPPLDGTRQGVHPLDYNPRS